MGTAPRVKAEIEQDGTSIEEPTIEQDHGQIVQSDQGTQIIWLPIPHHLWAPNLHKVEVEGDRGQYGPRTSGHEWILAHSGIAIFFPEIMKAILNGVPHGIGRVEYEGHVDDDDS